MSGVIMGALSFRQRNPHRFLIRTCQVSIKEVPSPPQVSIEIELTNKNSLAALFTQSGVLLYCIFSSLHLSLSLYVYAMDVTGHLCRLFFCCMSVITQSGHFASAFGLLLKNIIF